MNRTSDTFKRKYPIDALDSRYPNFSLLNVSLSVFTGWVGIPPKIEICSVWLLWFSMCNFVLISQTLSLPTWVQLIICISMHWASANTPPTPPNMAPLSFIATWLRSLFFVSHFRNLVSSLLRSRFSLSFLQRKKGIILYFSAPLFILSHPLFFLLPASTPSSFLILSFPPPSFLQHTALFIALLPMLR